MIEGMLTFKTISEFYDADPQGRRRSEEAGYGVFWRMRPFSDYWRVSYIRNTGEVYGVHLSGRDDGAGPVVVLGTFPPDAVTDRRGENRLFYRTLERWLDGWPQECRSGPNSLLWVKERLDSAVVGEPWTAARWMGMEE